MIYPLVRSLLFTLSPEQAHHFSMKCLSIACSIPAGESLISSCFRFPSPIPKTVSGIEFPNPVGLGAGFDKNAQYLAPLKALGFGFVEVGTITPLAQPGNDKPRLFRLPADEALINRMGFNNDGMEAVKSRLANWKNRETSCSKNRMIVGANLGKNKITPNEDAWKDYLKVFQHLHEEADYFVVNVSSPNTPGLRELQDKGALLQITERLQHYNQGMQNPKPIWLKIAPDLSIEQLNDIVELANRVPLNGLVATNTTISRENLSPASREKLAGIGMGGLSGKPLQSLSKNVFHYLKKQCGDSIPIISSGGIITGSDGAQRLLEGADLIQIWTGFIYSGPSLVKQIGKELASHQ